MKIAIFGGSFDPVHKAHIELSKMIIKKLSLDKLIFVPTYKNPFKINEKIESTTHRVNMIKLVLPKKCEISDFEIKQKKITYSIDTIKFFKKQKKDKVFFLIGTDNINSIHKWKDINSISKLVQLIAFKRFGNYSLNNVKKYNIKILDNKILNYSSSNYKKGEISIVNKRVQKYIANNFLYLNDIVKNSLNHKRAIHCENVAKLAQQYAKINKLNERQAYFAGLMHDFTKYWSIDKHKKIINKYLKDITCPNPVLHQYSSALWLKYIYLCPFSTLTNAIMKHTTADIKMSKFDKIIYTADKLEINRKFTNIDKIRNLAIINIDEAFKILISKSRKYLIKENKEIDNHSLKIFEKWGK